LIVFAHILLTVEALLMRQRILVPYKTVLCRKNLLHTSQ